MKQTKRILHFDCSMGAAGDMMMGALLELMEDKEAFLETMNNLGLSGVDIRCETVKRWNDIGTHVHVDNHVPPEHGTTLAEIEQVIESLPVSRVIKNDAKAVYRIIAEAEAAAHDQTIVQTHFHEVGTPDAIADVIGTCLLMKELNVDCVTVSPIHVGRGVTMCAHGLLSVPAPATAAILQGIPFYSGQVEGELCTPTGAALLKYFGHSYGPMPDMTILKTGRGMGTKEFPGYVNGLGVILGTMEI